jgi:hypothetical protein
MSAEHFKTAITLKKTANKIYQFILVILFFVFTVGLFFVFHYVYHSQTTSVVWWSEFLATDPEVWVRFPALPDFLRSSGSGTGYTLPLEYN